MFEKVWAIKGREEKVASNGNKYLQVTIAGDDGKDHKHNLYEQGMWAVFKNNDYVKVQLEKPEGGRWEVKNAVAVADELKPPQSDKAVLPKHQKEIDRAQEIPPVDFDKVKDRDGMPLSVKLRTFCISYAKDIGVGKMQKGEDMSVMTIMGIATMLEKWVITGTYREPAPKEPEPEPELDPEDLPF
uniref:Uncharacterized protein n=1 Tax=viral metagenome TaxID=1070528 RepID=A0A6M3LKN4_9ZZZZ